MELLQDVIQLIITFIKVFFNKHKNKRMVGVRPGIAKVFFLHKKGL